MSYAAEWLPSAESELANLGNDAGERAAVTAAANRLDGQWQISPVSLGESRGGANRIAFETPLAMLFDIDEARLQRLAMGTWLANRLMPPPATRRCVLSARTKRTEAPKLPAPRVLALMALLSTALGKRTRTARPHPLTPLEDSLRARLG
jgi:hypothetical protein